MNIDLIGQSWTVVLPASFCLREDIVEVFAKGTTGAKSRRAYGAAIGLCVGEISRRAKADYDGDPSVYGLKIYDWLRSKGARPKDIEAAGTAAWQEVLTSLFPREAEVQAKEVFSEAPEGTPT